ncbi:N-acetylated-alpha-linked acidic dipeptidase-like protein [Rhizodiscina lignyota]|uniref:N-acetylated-alpha-linked acidic dipeptidase-like protein n=1 Tax=Rhizodiscina lignyota TaxID=1504668 RepID=A0A9P4I222_9PEZI|nr:N-acetylated-alpha-linked acidic dipeptidase-like protein [Rhizodiscina lignyota]
MSGERTPLLAVVRVEQPRRRYPHQTLRRFCTFLLSAVLLIAIVVFLLLLFVIPDCEDLRRHNHRHSKFCLSKHPFFRNNDNTALSLKAQADDGLTYDELIDILAETPTEEKAKEWSAYYTAGPHLAGKNLSQAEWTRDKWTEFGVNHAEIVAYDIYTNYPLGHRLALLEKESKSKEDDVETKASWKVKYEASLEEDVLEEDHTSGLKDRIPTFHGYSASGNVTASYVFCNYGTFQDFEDLQAANVSLKGKIAVVKYGEIFRGLKIKRAQELGMVGAVIYSDPGDDSITEEDGYEPYPKGPARNPSSVQRGSVQFLSIAPGDPTTPGWPSKPGCPRVNANHSTPSIPSVPISYLDALPILKALNGHGPKASSLGKSWKTGGLGYKGVKYNIGPTPDNVALNLFNEQEYVITPQWDVIGFINGTLQDEVVILGNHRDAWIAGGAADPNSGSAALNEVVRSFGVAVSKGWKPLRTIVFASWDGEEYGLLGSTEWVEDYVQWLGKTAVAYLNVDVGADGTHFKASAAPLLNQALIDTTKMILSANQTKKGQTVYDLWDKQIRTMGSGSDFTAFQDFAGIPCVDLGFDTSPGDAVYHYHSNYDSFDWMNKFGDKGWHYHATVARVFGVLAAKISETPIIPFHATDYADALLSYLDRLKEVAANTTDAAGFSTEADLAAPLPITPDNAPFNFAPLVSSINRLHNASTAFDAKAAKLQQEIDENPIPWWRWWSRVKQYYAVRKINDKYKMLERQFLYHKGFDKRPWFKHVVFAPGIWTGYAGATFPPLVEAIEEGNKGGVYKWTGIITGLVEKAASLLED